VRKALSAEERLSGKRPARQNKSAKPERPGGQERAAINDDCHGTSASFGFV
jgi:hypothetical protein